MGLALLLAALSRPVMAVMDAELYSNAKVSLLLKPNAHDVTATAKPLANLVVPAAAQASNQNVPKLR
jgi:hypothetical protein